MAEPQSDNIFVRVSNVIFTARSKYALPGVAILFTIVTCRPAAAQQCSPLNWAAEQDHRNMMEQLGIKALRPGPSGNENNPTHANYDEAKANPYATFHASGGLETLSTQLWWANTSSRMTP